MRNFNYLLWLCIALVSINLVSCSQDDDYDNETNISTRAIDGIYTFPLVSEIVKSDIVKKQMEEAWSKMKSNASEKGRSEYGFFIYYDHDKQTYSCGSIVAGPVVSGCIDTNASISLGIPTDNKTVCAFFHCHTTLEYCPADNSRKTGPSDSDKNYANKMNFPGILYDYSASTIYGGQSKNSAYKIYTFGPNKRPDMPY